MHDPEPLERPALKMVKRQVTLPDGRPLIYYTFTREPDTRHV